MLTGQIDLGNPSVETPFPNDLGSVKMTIEAS